MLLKAMHTRLTQALEAAQAAGLEIGDHVPDIKVEVPRDTRYGDYATNLAMTLAKPARKNPRQIAEALVAQLQDPMFAAVEIAGAGFINFRLSWPWLREHLTAVLAADTEFGQQPRADVHRYLIEFVSANPTGPLHFGHGRWAVLGDCLARLMKTAGFDVSTEFYINDTGSQINNLGASVQACYYGLLKGKGVSLSEAESDLHQAYVAEKSQVGGETKVRFYHGGYIQEIAQKLYEQYGDEFQSEPVALFSEQARTALLTEQQQEMEEFGVHFDEWFPESRLHAEGAIQEAIQHLREAGVTEERDGALWFKSSEYGDDKDRVLIKQDGSTTYFANDIAYHWDKLRRRYDRLINIWGADHHGYIPRMQAAVQALGYPKEALQVLLGQIVHLFRNGEPIRMSKRTGEMVTFGEVFAEVGKDATRYLLMQRSADATIDFDLELAKQQSSENPVFYIQYAHARICSIFRTGRQSETLAGVVESIDSADLSLLEKDEERTLLVKLLNYPDELVFAAVQREPHRLATYASELAATFHQFYKQCRVLDDKNPELSKARLALTQATRIVIRNLLTGIFGISAPESM